MWNKLGFVLFVFCATVTLTKCLPRKIPSHIVRNIRAYIYDVNGIDHHEDTSENTTTSSEQLVEIVLIKDNTPSNPWDTLAFSLRNGVPPPVPVTVRGRFSHFYKRKPNEPFSNIDPIVFPSAEDESPTAVYGEESSIHKQHTSTASYESKEKLNTSDVLDSDEEEISSSSSSSTEAESFSTTENEKSVDIILESWLWESLRSQSDNKSASSDPQSDITTLSLLNGPKFKKGRLGKIVCPPGQRPNHFGECKCPITLKQSDYD